MKNARKKEIDNRQGAAKSAIAPGIGIVALLALIIYCIVLCLEPTLNFDMWWMLKAGEEIVKSRSIPRTDPFSYTSAGNMWLNHEWLLSVIFYLVNCIGGYIALTVLKTLALIAIFAFGIAIAYSRKGGNLAAAALAALWMLNISFNYYGVKIRASFFAFIFIILTWFILERAYNGRKKSLMYFLIPLSLIWWNCHGTAVFILIFQVIFLGVYLLRLKAEKLQPNSFVKKITDLGYSKEDEKCNHSFIRPAVITLVLSFFIAFINPYGIKMIIWPFEFINTASTESQIAEFQRPEFFGVNSGYTWSAIIMLALVIIFIKRFRLTDIIIFAIANFFSLQMIRHLALYSVLVTPVSYTHLTLPTIYSV